MPLIIPDYGKRSVESKSIEVNRKFFFIFEGNETEYRYFVGLRNSSKEIGINDMISIVPIPRNRRDTNSHMLEQCKTILPELNIDHDVDKLFLIIDRDKGNLFENQLETLFGTCEELNLNIGLSNPCFEFWLMCHFDDVFLYSESTLLENERLNKTKRFLDKALSDKIGGYNKRNLVFSKFKHQIDQAVKNSKAFQQDVKLLKTELGTNIGLIIEEMM